MEFKNKLEEALHVYHWHMYSDKTSEAKNSIMTIEEAEAIIQKESNNEE